ncbi:MAG: hypothetical protein WC760_12705 [Bacteroidia bacterium]|jgi:CTP synthase (UTP-ammonia lyase)
MKLAIIGDFQEGFRPHRATNEAIGHAMVKFAIPLQYDWIPTDTAQRDFDRIVSTYSGFWIAPGSPYKSMAGALRVIQFARENKLPVLGTCGGFQHMVIEYARNVLRIKDAEHAEYDPYASKLVINPLSCSLAGQTLEIELIYRKSQTFEVFGQGKIKEKYYCNFGLNPEYQNHLHTNGFKIVGTDSMNEARILELEKHPFFIATLFVPQDNSTPEVPHKLVTAFLRKISNGKGAGSIPIG